MAYTKGDILRGHRRCRDEAYHPIVYWESLPGEDNFIGLMITSSTPEYFPDNHPMLDEHFDANFHFRNNNSHLVKGKFIKLDEWKPFRKVGKLTPQGIQFAASLVEGLGTESFKTYLRRTYRQ